MSNLFTAVVLTRKTVSLPLAAARKTMALPWLDGELGGHFGEGREGREFFPGIDSLRQSEGLNPHPLPDQKGCPFGIPSPSPTGSHRPFVFEKNPP